MSGGERRIYVTKKWYNTDWTVDSLLLLSMVGFGFWQGGGGELWASVFFAGDIIEREREKKVLAVFSLANFFRGTFRRKAGEKSAVDQSMTSRHPRSVVKSLPLR